MKLNRKKLRKIILQEMRSLNESSFRVPEYMPEDFIRSALEAKGLRLIHDGQNKYLIVMPYNPDDEMGPVTIGIVEILESYDYKL